MNKTTPIEVAKTFCNVLREYLTADEMEQAVQRNTIETSQDVCHTHDFCDANMAMAEAMDRNGLPTGPDSGCEPVWNEAWKKAFSAQFDASKVV